MPFNPVLQLPNSGLCFGIASGACIRWEVVAQDDPPEPDSFAVVPDSFGVLGLDRSIVSGLEAAQGLLSCIPRQVVRQIASIAVRILN